MLKIAPYRDAKCRWSASTRLQADHARGPLDLWSSFMSDIWGEVIPGLAMAAVELPVEGRWVMGILISPKRQIVNFRSIAFDRVPDSLTPSHFTFLPSLNNRTAYETNSNSL
jgi:hypothetical protein